jgi:DNA-binding NarL/FixJ family response regulator
MPHRILLADDHALLRDGLRALLEASDLRIVGEAENGREAIRLAREANPDVVVIDICMPVLNGIDATRAILRARPAARVIVLTMHEEDVYVVEALQAGARGYVLKSQCSADLVRAIDEVMQGAVYLSPAVSSTLVEAMLAGGPAPRDPLTPREREVLQLVAEGRSTKEVAAAMGISVKTAETHRSRMMSKLGIHHTAGLVRYALRRGLTTA